MTDMPEPRFMLDVSTRVVQQNGSRKRQQTRCPYIPTSAPCGGALFRAAGPECRQNPARDPGEPRDGEDGARTNTHDGPVMSAHTRYSRSQGFAGGLRA